MTRTTKVSIAALGLVFLAVFVVVLLPKPQLPMVALPTTNGYDDFAKAANALRGDPLSVREDNATGLRALVDANQEALGLVAVGLDRDCVVPPVATLQALENRAELYLRFHDLAWLLE